jgi:glycine/D-amino acid oxidase-like deaminating enzyme
MIAQVGANSFPSYARSDGSVGFRPLMPNSLPFIGPSPHDARVLCEFGHGYVGVTFAGVAGRTIADLMSDSTRRSAASR